MIKNKTTNYDVIIIGSGIGGLICGCYLAKAGIKVLIIEKNDKPGGYCTSFEKNRFIFDAGVHVLTGFKSGGPLDRIFTELGIYKKIKIVRSDPTDIIVVPDHKIYFWNDIERTINDLQEKFPDQAKGINEFFNFLNDIDHFSLYSKFREKTFEEVLNNYFSNYKLRQIMTTFLGVLGLPSYKVSAYAGVSLYQKFIFDGGYYPLGGMQNFSDCLTYAFQDSGGEIIFSHLVKKIIVKNKRAEGVLVKDGNLINSKYVVSDCDVNQTFFELVGREFLKRGFLNVLDSLIPSVSAFIVNIGVNKSLKNKFERCGSLWFASDYNVDNFYSKVFNGIIDYKDSNILCSFSSFHDNTLAPQRSETISLIIPAPYKDITYWNENKIILGEELIRRARNIIPDLTEHITVKQIATPLTLHKFTLNYKGAMRGWASLPFQIDRRKISFESPIEALFLAGHWTTYPGIGGIASVLYSGYNVARSIIRMYK